jgi:hypothetical protein
MNQIIQNIRDRGYLSQEDLSQLGEIDSRIIPMIHDLVGRGIPEFNFMIESRMIKEYLLESILINLDFYKSEIHSRKIAIPPLRNSQCKSVPSPKIVFERGRRK